MTIALINRGADYRGKGLPNIIPAFPSLNGALYASYIFGTDYGTPGEDTSGNGRALAMGSAVVNAQGLIAAISGANPVTPFTPAQLCDANGTNVGCTIIALATIPADLGTTVGIANSGNASPYIAQIVDPAGNTNRAFNNAAGSSTASSGLTAPAGTFGALSLFGSRHSSTVVQASVRRNGGPWTHGAQTATTKVPSGAQPLKVGLLAAAAAAGKVATIHALGLYQGVLSDEQFNTVAATLTAKYAPYSVTI